MAWIRPVLVALTLLGVVCSSVLMKTAYHARNEYTQGTTALQEGDFVRAVTHFNRAIHWYSPGNEAVRQSIEALWDIGTAAQSTGDHGLALDAFQSLRSSLYSARSFYTPYPDWIAKCDDRIAALYAHALAPSSSEHSPALETNKTDMLKILKMPTAPDVMWSLLCEGGFIGWIACSIAFILRVFAPPTGFYPRRAVFWGGLFIGFYAFWILGMLNA